MVEKRLMITADSFITYKYSSFSEPGTPTMLFLHGLHSSMDGTKGGWLEQFCQQHRVNFLRLNYLGHGSSSGKITDYLVGDWLGCIEKLVDTLAVKQLVVVGSSLGGWLACHLALRRPELVKSLVLIAPAIDFPTTFLEPLLKDPTVGPRSLEEYGIDFQQIRPDFLKESKNHNLFTGESNIAISCPTWIIQGVEDRSVPYGVALELMRRITNPNVRLTLVKDGEHDLNRPEDITIISQAIEQGLR